MTGGTYVLKIKNKDELQLTVGSLGKLNINAGWYAYVGSSRTTDFKRVNRHIELSEDKRDTRHWHIDYLLGSNNTEIQSVYKTNSDVECSLAQNIDLDCVSDFGCSDCSCRSHLFYDVSEDEFDVAIEHAFEKVTDDFREDLLNS